MNIHLMKTSESLSLAAFYRLHLTSITNIAFEDLTQPWQKHAGKSAPKKKKKKSKHHVSIFVHTTEPAIKIKTSQKRRISEPACRTR
jgi:hypothetical protein